MWSWFKQRKFKSDNSAIAHAHWQLYESPATPYGPKTIATENFVYPFPGAAYQWRTVFYFMVKQGEPRGVIYRIRGGGEVPDDDTAKYILREVMEHYEQAALAVIAGARKYEAELEVIERQFQAEKEQAQRKLDTFVEAFKAKVADDVQRVIAALRKQEQAEISDWLTLMPPPSLVRSRMVRVVEAAQQSVADAKSEERNRRYEEQRAVQLEAQLRETERLAAIEVKTSQPIHLATDAGTKGDVVFGTGVETGEDFAIPVRQLQHMLVAGVAGSGKSVLLHSLCAQFVDLAEVERVIAIDLKGGLEFERYSDNAKVQVVWDFADVVHVVDGIMQLMVERQNIMREKRQQNWPGGRVVVVIDEYAELQTEIDAADSKEAKGVAKRFASSMVSISRRARALGVVLVCCLQKATSDAMDSSLRNNLSLRLVLRQSNKLTAAALIEDLDALSVEVTKLPTGRFYYNDTSRGIVRLLQAQIAPGVELG